MLLDATRCSCCCSCCIVVNAAAVAAAALGAAIGCYGQSACCWTLLLLAAELQAAATLFLMSRGFGHVPEGGGGRRGEGDGMCTLTAGIQVQALATRLPWLKLLGCCS